MNVRHAFTNAAMKRCSFRRPARLLAFAWPCQPLQARRMVTSSSVVLSEFEDSITRDWCLLQNGHESTSTRVICRVWKGLRTTLRFGVCRRTLFVSTRAWKFRLYDLREGVRKTRQASQTRAVGRFPCASDFLHPLGSSNPSAAAYRR